MQASKPREISEAATTGRYGLAADLTDRLASLRHLPPPDVAKPQEWSPVVADALRLAREGWAVSALAQGWSVHDLFGIGSVDSYEFAGLAVWLAGRAIVTLAETMVVAGEGDERGTFHRGGLGHGKQPTVAPVLLWQFGRDGAA